MCWTLINYHGSRLIAFSVRSSQIEIIILVYNKLNMLHFDGLYGLYFMEVFGGAFPNTHLQKKTFNTSWKVFHYS